LPFGGATDVVADRPLHIAIDGRELVGRPTGVGRYLSALLGVWAKEPDLPHRFSIIAPGPPPEPLTSLAGRFTWIQKPARHAGTWWEQATLSRAAARARPDVFFAPGYTAPLRLTCRLVVTIHDLAYFAHPEWFPAREGFRRRWLTRAAARRAAAILTDSEFSAREITARLAIPPSRVHVVLLGAPPPALDEPNRVRRPVVLFVGSLFNRRHIPELLRAFATALGAVPDARLVLVGDNRTHPRIDPRQLAAGLSLGDRVEWREYVSDRELDDLYRSARVFAFLSDYEGFALTPLEALAHGVPAVLVDTPVSREIYGASVRLVDPDPPAIAEALVSLLGDDRAHAELAAAGRRRVADFSWARAASATLRVLEDAAR
jgi:glycosyltransferase involved in cell wall biosynthesis